MVGRSSKTKEEKAGIVMEALSNTMTIAEICRKYNVTASAFYRWRDDFIAAGTAALEPGKSSVEQNLMKENSELKTIIGELTVTNEKLKKIHLTRRGGH